MSGIEVVGLVLGGIPLAIWALEKYAEPFESFHHYRISIETFRADLILQNRQLRTTLANVGLGSEPSAEELRECFGTKFPSISSELIFIIQRMDEVAGELMKHLDIDSNQKPGALAGKLHWEWRRIKHGFNTKRRSKVIEDLRRWNADLRVSLEKPEVPAEDDCQKVQDLKRRFSAQRCSSIRQSLGSLHRALRSGFRCHCSPPHQVAVQLDWEAYESAPDRRFKVAISYGANNKIAQPSRSWRRVHITSVALEATSADTEPIVPPPPPTKTTFSTSKLRSKMVRIGFSSLSGTTFREAASSVMVQAVSTTSITCASPSSLEITSLCETICTDFSPGTLPNPDRDQSQHFSFECNQSDSLKIIRTVPLKSLFEAEPRPPPMKRENSYPSLSAKQRYGVAASLAWSVLHLSGSGWLGGQWDERQAGIFLERSQSGRELLSRYPCASYVFDSSECADEATGGDFRHLIPNRNVFSLGILLIELCINRPFLELGQDREDSMAPSLLDIYQMALGKLDEVYSTAGDSYGYAVERCVKFSFQGRDAYKDFDISTFRQQFYDAVVAPVQATYLLFPDSYNRTWGD